jgi:hypothetical protein
MHMTLPGTPCAETENAKKPPLPSAQFFYCSSGDGTGGLELPMARHRVPVLWS